LKLFAVYDEYSPWDEKSYSLVGIYRHFDGICSKLKEPCIGNIARQGWVGDRTKSAGTRREIKEPGPKLGHICNVEIREKEGEGWHE
jgi:hypothetical protein